MSEQDDKPFWDKIAKATTPSRTPAKWAQQRAAIHETIHPHRPGMRFKWVFAAAPVLAAAAFILHSYKGAPKPEKPPLVADIPAPLEKEIPPPEDENWDVRATDVTGEVVVTTADGVDSLLSVDAPLQGGDQIEVPPEGSLEIAFAADSVMTFGPGSRLTIGSIKKTDSIFEMALGTLVAKLNWSKREGYRMRVRTPTAVAAVRGTEFAVEVQEDGVTDIGVFDEGKIAVTDRREPEAKEIVVTPKTEIRFEAQRMKKKPFKLKKLEKLAKHSQDIKRLNRRQQHFKKNWKEMTPKRREQWRKEKIVRPPGKWQEKLRQRREKRQMGRKERPQQQRGQNQKRRQQRQQPQQRRQQERKQQGRQQQQQRKQQGRQEQRKQQGRQQQQRKQQGRQQERRQQGRQEQHKQQGKQQHKQQGRQQQHKQQGRRQQEPRKQQGRQKQQRQPQREMKQRPQQRQQQRRGNRGGGNKRRGGGRRGGGRRR